MKIILLIVGLILSILNGRAELVTLTYDGAQGSSSSNLQITAQQSIEYKSTMMKGTVLSGNGPSQPYIVFSVNGITFTNSVGYITPPVIFAGPGSAQIFSPDNPNVKCAVTFDIEPAAFPPDKTMTLGAYSGNVAVTMEESTDLVNWTPSNNGQVHTNAPDARFFRIKMDKNAAPPP